MSAIVQSTTTAVAIPAVISDPVKDTCGGELCYFVCECEKKVIKDATDAKEEEEGCDDCMAINGGNIEGCDRCRIFRYYKGGWWKE